MAVGVKGLLSNSKESFVVCAFRRAQASESKRRGFGGLAISDADEVVVELSEAWNVAIRADAHAIVALRSLISLWFFELVFDMAGAVVVW